MLAPRSSITGVPGWETDAEQRLLVELARGVPEGGLIVEIGAEFGMSASLFAHATRGKSGVRIVSVDLFPGTMLAQHIQTLDAAGFTGIERIQGDSKVVWQTAMWQDPIDLLFVDGDHSYEGVKADIAGWTNFVRPGSGVVVFHDCACATNRRPHPQHYDVSRAVNEWHWDQFGAWTQVHMVDSCLAFRRESEPDRP